MKLHIAEHLSLPIDAVTQTFVIRALIREIDRLTALGECEPRLLQRVNDDTK